MATILDIYSALDRMAPFDTAMDFDNAGLLVGSGDTVVKTVGVSLDISEQVIQEASQLGCELIVSHHPVIMQPVKSISAGDLVYRLIQLGISVIAAHTNMDSAQGGVNDCLARKIGLEDIKTLETDVTHTLRQGKLHAPLSPRSFAQRVKEALGCEGLEYLDGGAQLHTVAVGGGSCSGFLQEVLACGADALLTADVKYHTWLEAKRFGLTLVDAGHYQTECVIKPAVASFLSSSFPALKVVQLQENPPTAFI